MNSALFPPSGSVPGDVINVSDLAVSGPDSTAEQWEGCLVKLLNVAVATPPDEYGEWRVHIDQDTVHVGDEGAYTYVPVVGDSLTLTGLLGFSSNRWLVQPRNDEDIVVFYI
jgi:hypothetical protein